MKNNSTPFTDPSLLYQMQLRRKTTRHENGQKKAALPQKHEEKSYLTHTLILAKIEGNTSNNKHVQYTFLHVYYTRNSKMVNSR